MKDKILTIRIDEDSLEDIKKIAEQKGLTYSSLVRMWIKERISGEK